MRKLGIVVVLSLLLVAISAAVAQAANPHVVTGFPEPGCIVTGTTVDCTSTELAGVGNNNAVVTLTATYSGTVECNNPGENPNNPIEVHETTFDVVSSSGIIEPKNGRLVIPALSASPRGLTPEEEATLCPNPNWEADLLEETVQLVSFTYTIDFVDADGNVTENFFTQTGP